MSRGYSFDLRERAIGLVEGGMSRRAAARHLMISASLSIKWHQRFEATGSFAEKPGKKLRPSPLDDPAEWLLALVADKFDMTLAEIEARLLAERQFKTTDSLISRYFSGMASVIKKRGTPASNTEKTWLRRARNGKKRNRRLIQKNWFLSMRPPGTCAEREHPDDPAAWTLREGQASGRLYASWPLENHDVCGRAAQRRHYSTACRGWSYERRDLPGLA